MPINLRVKIWADGQPEPEAWTLEYSDTDPLPGVTPGLYAYRSTGTGEEPMTFDDYAIEASWGPGLAADSFTRAEGASWGVADMGGAWTATGSLPGKISVSGGQGVITLAANGGEMLLTSVSAPSARSRMTYTVGGGPDTGGRYIALAHRVQGSTGYRLSAWHRPQGDVWALIQKSGTAVAQKVAAIPAWSAGQRFHIKGEAVDPNMFPPRIFIGAVPVVRAYVSGEAVQGGGA